MGKKREERFCGERARERPSWPAQSVGERGNKTGLSKTARAAAKVLKAKGGLGQDLGRERGESGTREYFLVNWRHGTANPAAPMPMRPRRFIAAR